MGRYIIKRLLTAVIAFFGITIIAYVLANLMPGSPLDLLVQAESGTSLEELEEIKHRMGLDQPLYIQYFYWLGNMLKGNFGTSYAQHRPVLELISARIMPTLVLSLSAMFLAFIIAVPLGTLAGYKPYTGWDYGSTILAFVGQAAPNFFVAMLLIFFFAVKLKLLPVSGMYDAGSTGSVGEMIRHMTMPCLALSFQHLGIYTRQMRNSMLEALSDDYVRTARAKGLKEKKVLFKHALRNALHAQKRAAQFGIEARTNEGILNDPEIDIVVVLVPTPIHAKLIEDALNAGKNVYTEKTMTAELSDAKRLIELANEKNLYFGSAPDTFMGAAYQTARKAIDDGLIGDVVSFSMNINRNLDFMASLFEFLRLPGGGFAYDYGVYYLTAMTALLGPVDDLYAVVKNKAVERINCAPMSPDFGKPYTYENESQIYALVNLESGVTGTISMNGDSNLMDVPFFYIYGTKGILKLTCANDFGGTVELLPTPEGFEPQKSIKLDNFSPVIGEHRGIGPAEMALSMEQGRPNRASKEMAYHVLDIIETMMASSEQKAVLKVNSTCERPAQLTEEEIRIICG